MKPISGSCSTCKNTGGFACKGCKGTGKNKANGNPFERFKCYDCQARAQLRKRNAWQLRANNACAAARNAHAPPLSDSALCTRILSVLAPHARASGLRQRAV
jgi:hypothetical protein